MTRNIALILLSTLVFPRAAAAETTFPALLADQVSPQYAEKLATFGQFVGSWTFEGVEYHDDGTRATDRGELHFRWILQGEAIQDVWIETARSDDSPKALGTTLRFYDPKSDTWSITWVHPRYATARTMTGRKSGRDIVIEGTSSSGQRYRWIFSDIESDTFRWHAEKLIGSEWKTTEDLHARRITATSNSSAAFQQLLLLTGHWRGEHDGKPVTLQYKVTADGSALMEEFRPAGQAPMITMYSVDGDHLVATHYCSAGNQPQMVTQRIATPGNRVLTFSLQRITGMNAEDDWHNTGLELHLVDPDHLTQHWTWQSGGKSGTSDFQFVRTKG